MPFGQSVQPFAGAVCRTVVDKDGLKLVGRHGLVRSRLHQAVDVRAGVVDRDNHGDFDPHPVMLAGALTTVRNRTMVKGSQLWRCLRCLHSSR